MTTATTRRSARASRHRRVRQRVHGTATRPRLAVYRSNTHIYAQVIDDDRGHTLAAASSVEPGVTVDGRSKQDVATEVGRLVAERARAAGVDQVVFDRGGNRYAGRVRSMAEAAREGGLQF